MTEKDLFVEAIANFKESGRDKEILEIFDDSGKKKYVYKTINFGEEGVRTDISLLVQRGDDQWSQVFSWRQFLEGDILIFSFIVGCADRDWYYEDDIGEELCKYPSRSDANLGDVWFNYKGLPERLDIDLTIELFKNQIIREDFSRPILVPAGIIKQDWRHRPHEEFMSLFETTSDPNVKEVYRAVGLLLHRERMTEVV